MQIQETLSRWDLDEMILSQHKHVLIVFFKRWKSKNEQIRLEKNQLSKRRSKNT